MPVAGDEGYETLVICPYDKSHEVRQGRFQFHLLLCRKNYPNSTFVKCPYNTEHHVRDAELEYHIEHECKDRSNFTQGNYEVGDAKSSVAGLVDVHAGVVPEGPEDWNDYEATGSVLDNINQLVEERQVIRIKQCAPKSERKAFRRSEQERMRRLQREASSSIAASTSASSVVSEGPLRKPQRPLAIPVTSQDPKEALAAINSKMSKININGELCMNNTSDFNDNKSDFSPSYATAASEVNSVFDEPSSSSKSYATAFKRVPQPGGSANSSRPSTAMSIAASATTIRDKFPPSDEGFCQIPIPGLGRGRRPKSNRFN